MRFHAATIPHPSKQRSGVITIFSERDASLNSETELVPFAVSVDRLRNTGFI